MTTFDTTQIIDMYDSTDAAMLPADGQRFAGYVNGRYANVPAIRARFPKARVFGIDVLGDAWTSARVADWEPGNFGGQDPARLRDFIARREEYKPHTATLYCDRFDLPKAEEILAGLWHVVWISTLDGTDMTGQRTAAGNLIVATQVRGGMHADYDTSATLASWR